MNANNSHTRIHDTRNVYTNRKLQSVCNSCSQTGVWCVIEEVQVAQAAILSLLSNYISSLYDALRKRANTVKVADQPEVQYIGATIKYSTNIAYFRV